MKSLLFLLIIPFLLFSQSLIDERFNNFIKSSDGNTVGYWVFDNVYHANYRNDITANGHDLSLSSNFSDSTQFEQGSILYENGNVLRFDGVDDYYYIPNASATAFNPGTGDMTIEIWIKTGSDVTTSQTLIIKRVYPNWYLLKIQNGILTFALYEDYATAKGGTVTKSVSVNTIYYIVAKKYNDGVNDQIALKINNSVYTTSSFSLGTLNISNNGDFLIGAYKDGTGSVVNYFNGYIYSVRYSNYNLSEKEANNRYASANNWSSKNGLVLRSNWEFYQGVSNDTLYASIPDTNVANDIILNFNAYASSNTNLRIKLGNEEYNTTITTTWTNYTFRFDKKSFSNDYLYFITPETVFIDNIRLVGTNLNRLYTKKNRGFSSW